MSTNPRLITVKKNKDGPKKLTAVFGLGDGKTKVVKFGAKGYSDYTIHKDKDRRERYRIRHKTDLKTKDPTRPGFLSWYILWGNSTNLDQNIKKYKTMIRTGKV